MKLEDIPGHEPDDDGAEYVTEGGTIRLGALVSAIGVLTRITDTKAQSPPSGIMIGPAMYVGNEWLRGLYIHSLLDINEMQTFQIGYIIDEDIPDEGVENVKEIVGSIAEMVRMSLLPPDDEDDV